MLRHLGIAKIEDACAHYGQVFVARDILRQILSRSHNAFYLLTALEQLFHE